MSTTALVLAIVALVLAFVAFKWASSLAGKLQQIESSQRRALAAAEEAELRCRTLEQFLKMLAQGKTLDPDMIEEGRLFDEVDSEQAHRLHEASDGALTVLDVRSEQEVTGGHVEGALWIPINQIEERYREVPKEGRVLVVCAVGGRSAAACDFLTQRGFNNLTNVMGGMSAWPGPVKSGRPS